MTINYLGESKLIFWSSGKTAKKIGEIVGKIKILFDSQGWIFCMAQAEEKPTVYNLL